MDRLISELRAAWPATSWDEALIRPYVDAADPQLLDALTSLGPRSATPSAALRTRLLAEIASPRRRFAPLFDALTELFDLGDEAL